MVKAGKGSTGVAFFELGHGQPAFASLVHVSAPVEPCHPVVDFSCVVDLKNDLSGHLPGQSNGQFFPVGVQREGAFHGILVPPHPAGPHIQIQCVQGDLGFRYRGFENNFRSSGKVEALQIRFQQDFVMDRPCFLHFPRITPLISRFNPWRMVPPHL